MSEKQLGKRPQQTSNYPRAPPPIPPPNCPRCYSGNTKFCYYNNYSVTQPRYFCKGCRRYWTHGGVIRNIPNVGSGRKRVRHDSATSSGVSVSQTPPAPLQPAAWDVGAPYNGAQLSVSSNVSRGTFNQPIAEGMHMQIQMQMQPSIGGGIFHQNPPNSISGGLNSSFSAQSTPVSTNLTSFGGFNDFGFPFQQRQQLQPQLHTPSTAGIWTGQYMSINNNNNNNNIVTNPNDFGRVARDPTRSSNVGNVNEWPEFDDVENEGDALQSFKPSLP